MNGAGHLVSIRQACHCTQLRLYQTRETACTYLGVSRTYANGACPDSNDTPKSFRYAIPKAALFRV